MSEIEKLKAKFKSSNNVPVSSIRVSIEEFERLLDEIDKELVTEVTARDYWKEKATELANDINHHFNYDPGEHTSANCPVLNAIDFVNSLPKWPI